MVEGRGDGQGLGSEAPSLGEVAQVGQGPGGDGATVHPRGHHDPEGRRIRRVPERNRSLPRFDGAPELAGAPVGEGERGGGDGLERVVLEAPGDARRALAVLDGLHEVSAQREGIAQKRRDGAVSSLVAEACGQALGLAEHLEHLPVLPERAQGMAELQAEVDRLLHSLPGRGQVLERDQGLLEIRRRPAMRRPRERAGARLAAVAKRRVPELRAHGVMREGIELIGRAPAGAVLDGLHDARVQRVPAVPDEAGIRDLLGERVCEGVRDLRVELDLVQELALLEPAKAGPQLVLGDVGGRREQPARDVLADGGGRLQHLLVLGGESIDARGERGVHALGNMRDRRGLLRAVRPALAGEDAVLHEVADALLEEEGIALRPLDQELPDRGELGRAAEERVEQRAGPRRGQGVDADLAVVRLARPSVAATPAGSSRG